MVDKKGALIRLGTEFKSLKSFFEAVFYKNVDLAIPAEILFNKIKHYGKISAENWRDHIMEMFNIDPPTAEELKNDKTLFKKWNSTISSYYSIIKKFRKLGIIKKEGSYYVYSDNFLKSIGSVMHLLNEDV